LGKSARWRPGHARERRRHAAGEAKGRGEPASGLVLREHRVGVGLALGGVRGGDGVDDRLGLFVADLLVVVDNVAQVILSAVVRLTHAHGVVRQVDIAVVAEEFRHVGQSSVSNAIVERVMMFWSLASKALEANALKVRKAGPTRDDTDAFAT
jgi:hypothetical protein